MEQIRKFHNLAKRQLIQNYVRNGDFVLDVGCGQGGDIHKWKQVCAIVDMCDPDFESVEEAKKRSGGWNKCRFFTGDIHCCPVKKYNVICYNFSIQYIFQTRELFERSIKEIDKRLGPDGYLIGCVPNSDMIMMFPKFQDSLGNFMVRKPTTGNGSFGEKIYVHLVDTPFYKDGPRSEPIAYKDLLVAELNRYKICLISWEPFFPFSDLSKMYTYFIFKRY